MTAFGGQLYEALREVRMTSLVVGELGFAEIQEFKGADRERVVELMRGAVDYETLQHLKQDTPGEFAAFARHQGEQAARAARSSAQWIWWIAILSMLVH